MDVHLWKYLALPSHCYFFYSAVVKAPVVQESFTVQAFLPE